MSINNVSDLLKYTTSTNSTIDFSNSTYDGIRQQLYTRMANDEYLASLAPASTIGILLDQIAMIGDFSQYSIESAMQELYYSTAKLTSSIYLKARDQGVHIQRNIPASVKVDLFRESTSTRYSIPALSQFSMNGVKLFNRTTLLFNAGVAQINDVVLYQGEVKTQSFVSNGDNFQSYVIGDKAYEISDQDVYCYVNGIEWKRDLNGLFTFQASDMKFFENTTADGFVQIKFGDNRYGKSPLAGETITFTYVNTSGSDAQSAADNQSVSLQGGDIQGTTTTGLIGGDMARSAYFYQQMGASLSATNNRAVTRDDLKAIICTYEGVVDCVIRGQAEIAPKRKEWLNVIVLTLLTTDLWDNSKFDGLVNWLQTYYTIPNLQFVRVDPVSYLVDIDVTLLCLPSANLQTVASSVEDSIRQLFAPKVGTLGKSIYMSDIENAILTAGNVYLDAYRLNYPKVDFIVKQTEFLKLGNLKITTEYTSRSADSLIG